ncbi:MAG: hypothetical protein R3E96_14835 [Planctomycetota bacterium]
MQRSLPQALALIPSLLVSTAGLAVSQTVTVTRSASASDSATDQGTGLGTGAHAAVFNWMPQVPAHPSVQLVQVQTHTPLSMQAEVTVINPTSAPVSSGQVNLHAIYNAYSNIGGGWGGDDGGNTGIFLPVPTLDPGQSVTLPWSLVRDFTTNHEPLGGCCGLWSDVVNACVGTRMIPFTVNSLVQLGSALVVITPPLAITHADLAAEAAGTLTLTVELSASTGTQSYCPPAPHTGGQAAEMTAYGALEAGSTWFALEVNQLPADRFCVVFLGSTPGPMPFSGGTVCFGNPIQLRSDIHLTNATGTELFELDLTPITAGTTLYAQCLFREPGGFGTSNALMLQL